MIIIKLGKKVCELSKEKPSQTWTASNDMELEDEGDEDFMIHSLILKSAMLGSKATDGQRNIVSIKTKGVDDNDIEQPVFSLTQGRNDMIANFDLHLGTRNEIVFNLVEGDGPVYITCSHVLEMPPPDEQETLMTTVDGQCEELEEDEESEEAEGENGEENGDGDKPKRVSAAALKLRNGKKNGAEHTNGNQKEVETDEKPNKRKRN